MVAVAANLDHSLGLKGDVSVYITQQPLSQEVIGGSNGTFVVMAAGNAPLKYQWRFNGTNLAGATTSSFTRNNAQPAVAGLYSVMVSNAFGPVTSSNAMLTVDAPLILSGGHLVSTGFQFTVTFPLLVSVVIEGSTNLIAPVSWTAIYTNNTGQSGNFIVTDPTALNINRRFYRGRR